MEREVKMKDVCANGKLLAVEIECVNRDGMVYFFKAARNVFLENPKQVSVSKRQFFTVKNATKQWSSLPVFMSFTWTCRATLNTNGSSRSITRYSVPTSFPYECPCSERSSMPMRLSVLTVWFVTSDCLRWWFVCLIFFLHWLLSNRTKYAPPYILYIPW